MREEDITLLLEKLEAGTCSDRERALLERWFDQQSAQKHWDWKHAAHRDRIRESMLARISEKTGSAEKSNSRFNKWYIGLAAAILLASVSGLVFFVNQFHKNEARAAEEQFVVHPGTREARLTLSDGSSLRLDSAVSGLLSKEGDVAISKTAGNELRYESMAARPVVAADAKNELRTPRGGYYHMTLPDGTTVYLNTASTLVFPVYFTGDKRVVELRGEAFFAVTEDKHKPFVVRTADAEVLVTGTRFNVQAYPGDQTFRTTLEQGGVTVTAGGRQVKLVPGEQALLEGGTLSRKKVDVENEMGWRDGYFVFDDQELADIMRSISRWYDVDVEYRDILPRKKIGGTFARSKQLGELLKHLHVISGFSFRQEGRRLIVME